MNPHQLYLIIVDASKMNAGIIFPQTNLFFFKYILPKIHIQKIFKRYLHCDHETNFFLDLDCLIYSEKVQFIFLSQ